MTSPRTTGLLFNSNQRLRASSSISQVKKVMYIVSVDLSNNSVNKGCIIKAFRLIRNV